MKTQVWLVLIDREMRKRVVALTAFVFQLLSFAAFASAQAELAQTNAASTAANVQLLQRVPPTYPPVARQARIQGGVVLDVVIATDGSVNSATVVSGHPLLVQSAVDAVKQWKYKPYVLDGKPVEVRTQITVQFALQNRPTDSTQANLSRLPDSLGQPAKADSEDSAKQLEVATNGLKVECDQMPDGEPSYGSAYPNPAQKAAKKACFAHANLDTCCQTPIQQLWYCKAWADDPERVKIQPSHSAFPKQGVNGDYDIQCPFLLMYQSSRSYDNIMYDKRQAASKGWSLTPQELAAAQKVIADAEQKAKEWEAEQEAARQQELKKAREDTEREMKALKEQQAKLMAISSDVWKRLGPTLHKGDSQSHVKAALMANGFTSPVNSGDVWYCSDSILQQDGYNWINGCVSRDKAGRTFKALFIIAQRHRDPDTGVTWNQRVDKLLSFHYDDIAAVEGAIEDLRLEAPRR